MWDFKPRKHIHSKLDLPRNLAEALALPVYILEVSGLNLSRDTDCPDQGYSWFFSLLSDKCRNNASN
jgi:hypothetical protein